MTTPLDISRPDLIRTRDGRKVSELHVIADRIAGSVEGRFTVWNLFGEHWIDTNLDLVLIEPQPEPVWRYAAIVRAPNGNMASSAIFEDLPYARETVREHGWDRVGCVHILQIDLLGRAPSIVHPVKEEG